MNICYCGAGASYPHAKDCPYPFYGYGAKYELQWIVARDIKRKEINRQKEVEAEDGDSVQER